MRRPRILAWLHVVAGWSAAWASASDWPQFLGPGRNGAADLSGPVGDVAELWRVAIGSGLSGPVVAGGKVVVFHRHGGDEVVAAVEAATGKTLWSFQYPSAYRDSFGAGDDGPRSTPAIAADRVFALGAEGKLHALDFSSGKKLWAVDARTDLGAEAGYFGFGCSPLVDGDRVVVNLGGAGGAGVVAFDAATGKPRWKATDDEASYSSPIALDAPGGRAIAIFTRSGLRLLDAATGEVRASFPWRARMAASVNAMTPVLEGNEIFLSASYGTGAVLLRLAAGGVDPVWKSDEALSAHYATPVLRHGHLFGFDGRVDLGSPAFRCVELATGKVKWSRDHFGGGSVLVTPHELLILTDDGELVTAAPQAAAWKEHRRRRILAGPVRAHPAVAGGRLYARNAVALVALDLKAAPPAARSPR